MLSYKNDVPESFDDFVVDFRVLLRDETLARSLVIYEARISQVQKIFTSWLCLNYFHYIYQSTIAMSMRWDCQYGKLAIAVQYKQDTYVLPVVFAYRSRDTSMTLDRYHNISIAVLPTTLVTAPL